MKYLASLIWILPLSLFSQQDFSISGTIKDGFNNPLAYITVLLDNGNQYALTDEEGNYELSNLTEGIYQLSISSLEYTPIKKRIVLDKNLNLNFNLKENTEILEDVTIHAKKASTRKKEQAISIGSIELKDMVANTTIITDQIEKVSGVHINKSGSVGSNADISINGLSGAAVRIYIDQIPLEFLYPTLNLANVPLIDIKRVDVYKGVMPVDIGTDALAGGINIITEDKNKNKIKASYSIGSFNTHLGDLSLTLVDDKKNFVNLNGGVNYSDNNYSFITEVITEGYINENDPSAGTTVYKETQEVERFHDIYKLQHASLNIGTSNKKWADKAELSFNYLNSFKELQNGPQITETAIGEAYKESENISVTLKYDKTIVKDKLKLQTVSNLNKEAYKFLDTTVHKYNWLGDIYGTRTIGGELVDNEPINLEATGKSFINRSSLKYDINETNHLLVSNIIAYQNREILSYNFNPSVQSFETQPTQKITKDILGLQYQGEQFDNQLEYGTAIKYYNFNIASIDSRSNQLLESNGDFWGWNASIKYKITQNLVLRSSYERGFLIPEIYQFTGDGGIIASNAGIKPEESDNYNFGILYSIAFNQNYAISLITNAFLRKQKNIIYLNIEDTPAQYINGEDAEGKGLEGELKITFLKNFNWTTNISYLDKKFVSSLNEIDNSIVGTTVPNNPGFFYNTQLNWSKENILNSKIDFSIYGAFNHVDTFNFTLLGAQNSPELTPENYVFASNRIDAGISLQFLNKTITTAFNIINLTDEELFDNYGLPIPGINFNFKLIYELSNF